MAIIGSIDIITNSQNATTNTSKITVKGICQTTGSSAQTSNNTGTYTISQGNKVLISATFMSKAPANSTTILFSVDLTIQHDASGNSGIITVTFNYASGFCTGTQSSTLTKINRTTSLTVENGILGKEQTLIVTQRTTSVDVKHSIVAICGGATLFIKADGSTSTTEVKHTGTSIPFTPPLEWAKTNTTGKGVVVTYHLRTYDGSTKIGELTYKKSYSIPSTVSPIVTYMIEEANEELAEKGWDIYIQSLSKLKFNVTTEPAYGSKIVSLKTTVENKTYTESEFTTDEITSSVVKIMIVATDERGYSTTIATSVDVLTYQKPVISGLKVKRCNSAEKENIQGEYGLISFYCTCSSLNGNNEVEFDIYTKKTTSTDYELHETISYGQISGTTMLISSLFPADSASSYNVKIVARDALREQPRSTSLSTGFAIKHYLATGLGIAFGKIAELNNVLDIGFRTRFFGGILLMTLENGADANDLKTSNIYNILSADEILNMPEQVGGTLQIMGSNNETIIQQRFNVSDKTNPRIYERAFYNNAWGEWQLVSGIDCIIEQGTSGIWTYRKWRSGICEMWGTYEFTPSWTSGSSYIYQNITLDLPFTLTKMDTFEPTVKYSNFTTYVIGKTYLQKLTNVTFMVHQYYNESADTTEISLRVSGKWK